MKVIISDTSPVQALHQLGLLQLLGDLFGSVTIPPTVRDELARHGFSTLPIFVEIATPSDRARVASLENELDAGEAEAIALAIESKADLLLVDERLATRVATDLGIRTMGVLGVLLLAKREGRVAEVAPLIERLRSELRFYVGSSVVAEILELAGEEPSD
jgi:uncharacterized protein